MIAVALGAAVAGDTVGYEVGRRCGPWLHRFGVGRRVGAQRWARGEQFLLRHGGKAVLLGRFTAVLRALTPGLAGMSAMPYLPDLPALEPRRRPAVGSGMRAARLRLRRVPGHRGPLPDPRACWCSPC